MRSPLTGLVDITTRAAITLGRQPDGSLHLHDGMFNTCAEGRAGQCVKTEHIDDVPDARQCAEHRPAPTTELQRGHRTIRNLYLLSQRGRLAADGSLLDTSADIYAVSSAWRSPACEVLQCWRPEVLSMVPPVLRWCGRHGKQQPTMGEDPYDLTSDRDCDEWIQAEERGWRFLRSKHGVPTRYHNASLLTKSRTRALEAVRRLVDTDDYLCRFVMMSGSVGCGKTWGLYAYWRHLLIEKARVDGRDTFCFYPFPTLVTRLLDSELRAETLSECCEADELICDDWGSTYVKRDGMVHGLLEELVIHREARDYSMVATTNLAPRAFRKAFGERIYDRLRGEWGAWIDVSGPSLRRKAPKR